MIDLFKKSFKEWRRDKASHHAASLTFYAIFALAPIILIVIVVAGAFFGQQAIKGEIVSQISTLVGREFALAIQVIVENAHLSSSSILVTIISLTLFLYAASRLVMNLKYALNKIWDIKHKKYKKVHHYIKNRFLIMLGILSLGFLFVLFLVVNGLMAVLWIYVSNFVPISSSAFQIINLIISFGLVTFIVALIYRYIPDVRLAWKDVWTGAFVTTVLFMIGNFLIGIYMRNVSVGSVYGAAGSLVIILVWLYYIFQIFLFGAEVAKVYSKEKESLFRKTLKIFN